MPCARGCCASMKEHLRSVHLATSGELVRVNRVEQKLSRDLTSYKAMIDQGLEPHTLAGAWELQDRPAHEIEGRLPPELEVS